jgi:hypothetical protein
MRECVAEAERRKLAFRKFSLQDCRPMGVSASWNAATTIPRKRPATRAAR